MHVVRTELMVANEQKGSFRSRELSQSHEPPSGRIRAEKDGRMKGPQLRGGIGNGMPQFVVRRSLPIPDRIKWLFRGRPVQWINLGVQDCFGQVDVLVQDKVSPVGYSQRFGVRELILHQILDFFVGRQQSILLSSHKENGEVVESVQPLPDQSGAGGQPSDAMFQNVGRKAASGGAHAVE